MKNILSLLMLFSLTTLSFGQKAMPFSKAMEQGISIQELDDTYTSGIHADTSLGVFNKNQDEFISAYQKLLQELGKYLNDNKFSWDKATKGFNRIYFQKNGKIDYFIYHFKPGQLTIEQEKRFGELLESFIKNYTFPLTADKNFAQCSPVTYMPAAK